MEEDAPNGEENLDREGKRSRNEPSDAHGGKDAAGKNDVAPSKTKGNAPSMSMEQREEMEVEIQRMASEILDMAVDRTLNFCADKVLAEEEDEQMDNMLDEECYDDEYDTLVPTPHSVPFVEAHEKAAAENEVLTVPMGGMDDAAVVLPASKPVGRSSPSHGVQDRELDLRHAKAGADEAEGVQAPASWPGRARARSGYAVLLERRAAASAPPCFRAGCPQASTEQQRLWNGSVLAESLAAAARIKEVVVSPTRSSPRLAGATDQHALEKAKKRAAWRNLDTEGNLQGYILDPHLVVAV
ncbi:unnamed protein product [Urochloa humidicola]